jgi:hypothetical protein
LIGADSIKLHLENIFWFRKMARYQSETLQDLELLESVVKELADTYFPKEFKEWMKLKKRFEEGKLGLVSYLQRLSVILRAEGPKNRTVV